MKIIYALVLGALAAPVFGKGDLSCYEEPGTRKATCIKDAAVSANGDTRASPVFSGGPNGVRNTGYFMVANCAKGIVTLQDSDGVNFGGALSSATDASTVLTRRMCSISKPRKDPRLKQF